MRGGQRLARAALVQVPGRLHLVEAAELPEDVEAVGGRATAGADRIAVEVRDGPVPAAIPRAERRVELDPGRVDELGRGRDEPLAHLASLHAALRAQRSQLVGLAGVGVGVADEEEAHER